MGHGLNTRSGRILRAMIPQLPKSHDLFNFMLECSRSDALRKQKSSVGSSKEVLSPNDLSLKDSCS